MFLIKIIKNNYFLTLIGIIVWLFFFDRNDVFTQLDLIKKRDKLQKEKEYYIQEIASNKINLSELQTNTKSLEVFAREKYLMKKDNEDVFVFVTK